MSKVIKCKDIGIDCPFAARGKTVDEVLQQASEHARKHHGIEKVTQDYLDSWKKLIKEE